VIQTVAVPRREGAEEKKRTAKTSKTAKALAFHSCGRAFLEVFVVRFSSQCLNRNFDQSKGPDG